MNLKRITIVSSLAFAMWAPIAAADVIFTPGNNPQPDENNILFAAGETGTLITGEVDHSGVGVQFSSLTGQTLEQNGDLNVAERRRAPDTDPDRSNTCRNLILRAPGGRLRQTSAAMTCEGGARRCDAPGVTGGRAGVAPDRFRR